MTLPGGAPVRGGHRGPQPAEGAGAPDEDGAPTFSILVNNYNYRRFLGQALDSALQQMRDGDELIVVDDGSTDDSLALLGDFERRGGVAVIAQPNQGQLKAVRTAIEAASREVVVFLDSDDYFLPGYLDRLRGIYRDHAAVDFVFASAEVGGDAPRNVRRTRAELDRMALPAGLVGSTRWAASLFFEFVGGTTSGNSMRLELAKRVATLPRELDDTAPVNPLLARLLGVSATEAARSGLSADGVLVRVTSMLGAIKYCDDRPGYFYRIHGGNKFAGRPSPGRSYLRHRRRRFLISSVQRHFGLARRPHALELREEILQRHYGLRLRRRLHIRGRYLLAALRARGPLRHRWAAMAAAAGIRRGQPERAGRLAGRESTVRRRTAVPERGTAGRD